MEDISSTALVTVQAYRNIAEDPSKRRTLIQVFRNHITVPKLYMTSFNYDLG